MKNLANCKPSEFMRQTARIRRVVENWLNVTGILSIQKRMPTLIKLRPDMSDEEREKAFLENEKRTSEQVRKNFFDILDQVLEEHPDETLAVLALCCFVEPDHVDDYSVAEYLENFTELIQNSAVMGFFTLLMQLGQTNSSRA